MKYFVAEIHYCSMTPWDSHIAGVYSSLEKAISALTKWVSSDGGTLKVLTKEKDYAHFKIYFSEDDNIVCFIEPWTVDIDFPESF